MSEAPPLSQLNSWDVTSEQNAVRKQRGWVMILVRVEVLPCSELTKKEREMLSLFWCTQSNLNICTDSLIKFVNSLQGSTPPSPSYYPSSLLQLDRVHFIHISFTQNTIFLITRINWIQDSFVCSHFILAFT